MASVIKIHVNDFDLFNELLRDQMRFFNIIEVFGSLNSACWIHIGPVDITTHVNKHILIENDIKNWIKFVGFSRIDRCPIFFIPDGCLEGAGYLLNHLRENGLSIISRWGETNNVFIDRDMTIEDVEMMVNRSQRKKTKQIFSEVDPYGEEDWGE